MKKEFFSIQSISDEEDENYVISTAMQELRSQILTFAKENKFAEIHIMNTEIRYGPGNISVICLCILE